MVYRTNNHSPTLYTILAPLLAAASIQNKARDTLETQGAPDTLRIAKVLGRPKDFKGFQKCNA